MTSAKRDWVLFGLLAAGLGVRLAVAWAPFSYLADRGPLIDDSFYTLSIARNMARGVGITADGLHATSGFQPLYALLLVPIYALLPEDRIMPVHVALTFLALCGAVTGWLVFRIASRLTSRLGALFSLFTFSFSPYFLSHGLNGLETGAYGMLVALAFHLHLEGRSDSSSLIRLGAVLGLCILGRVDGVIMATAIGLLTLPVSSRFRDRARMLACLVLSAIVVGAPYFLFLLLRFDSLLPQSGAATRLLSLCYGMKFVDRGTPTVYFDIASPPLSYYAGSLREAVLTLGAEAVAFPASLVLPVVSAWRLTETQTHALAAVVLVLIPANLFFACFGSNQTAEWTRFVRLGSLLTLLWIPAYAFGALGQWWFPRYFFPIFLVMAIAAGPAFVGLREALPFLQRRSAKVYWLAGAALQFAAFSLQAPNRFWIHQKNLNVSSFFAMARVLDRELTPGERAGAFQTGTLSYFSSRTVVNLDGVVNPEATRALRDKTMASYLRQQGIGAVIDVPFIVEALLQNRSDGQELRECCEMRGVGSNTLVLIRNRVAGAGR